MSQRTERWAALLSWAALATGCRGDALVHADPAPSVSHQVSPPARPGEQTADDFGSSAMHPGSPELAEQAATGGPVLRAGAVIDAAVPRADDAGTPASGGDPFAGDPENRRKPEKDSDELQERAGHLFEAIASGNAPLADDFFFPRAPFLPLKDVADPDRYFQYLIGAYHRDIRELHAKRRDWSGAHYRGFTPGTAPGWVAPGHEYNKIGYYRSYGGKLAYEIDGRREAIDVHVVISYAGRWYVTHLGAIRHENATH